MAIKNSNLTSKQEAFCRYYAVENLSQRQAYIAAYGRGNKSDKSIDELSSRLASNVKVASRLQELKTSLAERVLWDKADMINDLKDICEECKKAERRVFVKGELHDESIDSKARSVAVNAIRTASEILGYKAADKLEVTATVTIEDIIKKGAGNSDY